MKSIKKAYLLLLFLGVFGAHRFYLGKIITGLFMLSISLYTIFHRATGGYGYAGLVFCVLICIYDFLFMHDYIRVSNSMKLISDGVREHDLSSTDIIGLIGRNLKFNKRVIRKMVKEKKISINGDFVTSYPS